MNGLPLTCSEFVSRVKGALQSLGYPAKDFAGHSFRAGAASTAAVMGIEDLVIKAITIAFHLLLHCQGGMYGLGCLGRRKLCPHIW